MTNLKSFVELYNYLNINNDTNDEFKVKISKGKTAYQAEQKNKLKNKLIQAEDKQ